MRKTLCIIKLFLKNINGDKAKYVETEMCNVSKCSLHKKLKWISSLFNCFSHQLVILKVKKKPQAIVTFEKV